ncbi:hypothetical protein JCM10213_000533 [Rhodosporidiobolus nylandii]
MGKKPPPVTLPTPKHCVPVSSAISSTPTAPAPERNRQIKRLTDAKSRPPALPPQQPPTAKRRKAKGRKNKDQDLLFAQASVGPSTSRIIQPQSEAPKRRGDGGKQAQDVGSRMKARMARAAQSASILTPQQTPRTGTKRAAEQEEEDPFVAVRNQNDGAVTFTRQRSAALNQSIETILGAKPSELWEQQDREARTKRQKMSADAMRRELMGMHVDEEDEPKKEELIEVEAEEDWVDMDDDEELLITPLTPPSASPPTLSKTAAAPPAKADFPAFAPSTPFTFPQQSTASGTPTPSFSFEFSPSLPLSSAAATPVPSLAATVSTAPNLPKALPLPPGAVPKPTLRSAAGILAGKKRKPKKLKGTLALSDYVELSDDDAEDWEDVVEKNAPKRPKDGKAVDGWLPSPESKEDTEKEDGEKGGAAEEKKKTRRERELLPAARQQTGQLVPKEYQLALLERAKLGNVITVMATGSGKTLVATLLIDSIRKAAEERVAMGGQKRMQLFLTNSVPLVHQQANALAHNTSLRVGKLFGGLRVNLCSASEWACNFEHYDVLVVTAQLILDSLAHGFLRMDQIDLLVFDEVHHGKSNHPFAAIIRDFYRRAPADQRPRILGLTASPLDSNAGIEEARKLEELFDAKLVTAPAETRRELDDMVAKPTVLQVDYEPSPAYERTELCQAVLDSVVVQDDDFKRYLEAADAILPALGPHAADMVWHRAVDRYKKFIPLPPESEDQDENDNPADARDADHADSKMQKKRKAADKAERKRMNKELNEKVVEDMKRELPQWTRAVDDHKPSLHYHALSPKLQKLIDVLKGCKAGKDRFCGIIFVNRRIDALIIAHILQELAKDVPELDWLRVDCVTGHGTGTTAANLGPRMQWHEQASVLTAFGNGETNLIIATSVVEEGLDVQPCNFVVRFDLYTTHVGFVQSRGRARARGSHYLLFREKDNLDEMRKLAQIARFELQVDTFLRGELELEDEDEEDLYGAATEADIEYFESPSTGACITPHFALSLLGRFCRSLPKSDDFTVNSAQFAFEDHGADEYGQQWVTCTLALPNSSKVRLVEGPRSTSCKIAKRYAAFFACKLLYSSGALDDHFLPLHTFPDDEPLDAHGHPGGSRKSQIEYEKAVWPGWIPPSLCDEVTTFAATLLHYGGVDGWTTIKGQLHRPLVLLTRSQLPATPAMTVFVDGNALPFFATSIGAIPVTSAQRKVLSSYSTQLWRAVLGKELRLAKKEVDGRKTTEELESVWLIAELQPAVKLGEGGVKVEDIAWERMAKAAIEKEVKLDYRKLDEEALQDTVIVDMAKNGCRYSFSRIRHDLDPYSALPPGRQSDKHPSIVTLMDYYLSFNDPFFHSVHVDKEQSLLEVYRLSKAVTFLTRTPHNDVQPTTKKLRQHMPRFALAQACLVHYLPASIFRTAYMLPSVLTDLDQRLLVNHLNDQLFDGLIDPEQLYLALMTPLELLGDAFLKFLQTVHLFATMERTAHEGEMHRARLKLISNSALCEKGIAAALPAYLVSKPFSSRQFLPPNYEVLEGSAPPTSAVLGGKTIADSVEAALGPAVETGYGQGGGIGKAFDLALAAAKAMDLHLPGVVVWDDFARLFGHPAPVEPAPPDFAPVEQALGYRFKHGSLLVEALTHPSKTGTVSFERLEFLGDAILDFHVLRWGWEACGSTLTEGHLTELKGGVVANETLAALAVELGLDRFLQFDHEGLAINMRLYRERIEMAKAAEIQRVEYEEEGSPEEKKRKLRPYWLTLDPPKAVADIVESLFGALFVDSGFDPAAAQKAFDAMLVPFVNVWVSPVKLKIDSIRKLLEKAQTNKCDEVSHVSSTLDARTDPQTGEFIPQLTRCAVVAHNYILGQCELVNPKTAKKVASDRALQYLNINPGFFATTCNCDVQRNIKAEQAKEDYERRLAEGLINPPDSDDDEVEKEVVLAHYGSFVGGGEGGDEGMDVDDA